MKNFKKTTISILCLFTLILASCSGDNDNDPEVIKLENVKISDFPLFGITPVSIKITDPVIIDNEEVEFGKIDIVIPNNISLNQISSAITSKELNLSKYNVLPNNDTKLNFETQTQIYRIVNVLNESEELLHYIVNIQQEIAITPASLSISDFKFEASKNTQLSEDVVIEHKLDNGNRQDIYLFVPEGTNFADLTPTATFDADEVFYGQDSSTPIVNINTPYPTTDTSFDFSYPKSFIIVLKDKANDRMKWVNVFVDVKNPVQLASTDITTPDVRALGDSQYFSGITTWKNVGNHKIELSSATTYENKVPDVTTNIIKADRILVAGGLEPGASANVNVSVAEILPVGAYKTTALFHTGFVGHSAVKDFVNPAKLNIVSNVVN